MSKIKEIIAREIKDSRGNPAVEVELETDKGSFVASCPSGASTGKNEALELTKTDEIVKNNYPSQMLLKAIVLLQNIPDFGLIWNMTVITHTFNVINIKINAETSQVIRHSMESLLQWKKE